MQPLWIYLLVCKVFDKETSSYSWERLKLLLCASKQLCGLELMTWRLCIMYRDFFSSSFWYFFFGNMMTAKKEGIACGALKLGEKGSSNKIDDSNNKRSATTSSDCVVRRTDIQWWSLNWDWDIVIFTLFACISMDFPLRTAWMWDQFDVEAIREHLVVPMKSA